MTAADRDDKPDADAKEPRAVPLSRGLSTKLLLLTVLFVMLAEILDLSCPSVAQLSGLSWSRERLATAAGGSWCSSTA